MNESPNEAKQIFKSAIDLLDWDRLPDPDSCLEANLKPSPPVSWYKGGYVNVGYNCLFRHAANKCTADKICIHNVGRDTGVTAYTYAELGFIVCQISNYLGAVQLDKKNKCAIVGPAGIGTASAMLTCATLGITHLVLFDSLHQEAFEEKVGLYDPDFIIFTSSIGVDLSNYAKGLPRFYLELNDRDLRLKSLSSKIILDESAEITPRYDYGDIRLESFSSSHPLFALFTSGSTGKPKYIVHGSAGYLIYSIVTAQYFLGLDKQKTICVLSDAGWINGHTYAVYSPLAIGSSTILAESPSTYCNPREILRLLSHTPTDILYIPVTMARIMMSYWDRLSICEREYIEAYGIYRVGTMGEMLSENVGEWMLKSFKPIVPNIMNSYFQTETGGIISANSASRDDAIHPSSCGNQIIRDQVNIKEFASDEAMDHVCKELVATCSWPGLMIDAVRERNSVFRSYFDSEGDFRFYDTGTYIDGKLYVGGRTDDVINMAGHRYSTHDIESLIITLPSISEVAAIGYRAVDDATESLAIFYSAATLKCSKTETAEHIMDLIFRRFGNHAVPQIVQQEEELIKNKAGKIMRRFYRAVLERKDSGDVSTALKPELLTSFTTRMKYND